MALCRCLQTHSWPKGRTRKYVAYVKPIGYPDTSLICGLCNNPGVIWLDRLEVSAYQNGQRIFDGPNAFTRMKAGDDGIQEIEIQDMPEKFKIDDAFIKEWHPRCDEFAHDEQEYQAIIRKILSELKEGGNISKDTFIRILNWKAPRVKGIVKLDEFEVYAKTIRQALQAPEDRKLEILVGLYGIGVPVGSTILHFIYPDRFPIMDIRTAETLHYAERIESKQRDLKRYPPFCSVILDIRQKHPRCSLRQIDRALFAYHKIELKPMLRKQRQVSQSLKNIPVEVSRMKTEEYIESIEEHKKRIAPKGYEDLTEAGKKLYEATKGITAGSSERILSYSDIKGIFKEKYHVNMQILPSDYCYNKINKGPDYESKFLLSLERGKYKFVDFYWLNDRQEIITWHIRKLNRTFRIGIYQKGKYEWKFTELEEYLR